MKRQMKNSVLAAIVVAMLAVPAFAQHATVKGAAIDLQGQPIADAKVKFHNHDDGSNAELKTNKKGEYYTIAMNPGTYSIQLIKDGKELFSFNNVQISLSKENVIDFNLQQEAQVQAAPAAAGTTGQPATGAAASGGQAGAAAGATQTEQQPVFLTDEQKKKLSPEKLKAYEEYEKAAKENVKIKGLNTILKDAAAADKAGSPAQAVQLVQNAVQQDPNRAFLWAVLGQYQLNAAKQQPVPNRKAGYGEAATSFKKAIDLGGASADKQTQEGLPTWWMVYGNALEGAGQLDDSVKAFETAADRIGATNPKSASVAYSNAGVVATKAGKIDIAAADFDKAIAADSTNADAYYRKGTALIAKVSTDKAGNLIVPDGTEEAFNKYLQMAPTGPNAESAKAQLQFLNAGKVKTGVKK